MINSNIFLILDGKRARSSPSIKNSSPMAVISSFTYIVYLGLIDFPKNLKNSLSGDNTRDVSPPIKAVS